MKDDPKVKQLNNIRVQLENLSHQCAIEYEVKGQTHADNTAFLLRTAALIVCQALNNIAYKERQG
jgi:hypothetical protein